MNDNALTERQRKWLASVRASLESKTGRTLEQWLEIADACPETTPKARQRWFKETHGLGQNYFMMVMSEQKRLAGESTRDPDALRRALWSNADAAAICNALQSAVSRLPDLVTGQRKGYTAWSRAYAFAAARPLRDGRVRLGLAVEPGADPRLQLANKEGWSERLKSSRVLSTPGEVDAGLASLMRSAWECS
jgi:hypothetical protein